MTRGRLAIHAHFYQPAREDPFTGHVPREPSAGPFHDWNERIAAENYRPNVDRGNVARIGWDLGPTLARWMRTEDRPLHDAWVAQDDAHNGIAQAYHHTILPLASVRDRRTEIRWGLRDFRLRFGRDAQAIWLPETAADHLTLRLCAEEGVRWTILAPWQAQTAIASEHPRRVEVGTHQMGVWFLDAQLSAALSFDPSATSDADRFANTIVRPRLDHARAGSPRVGAHTPEQPGGRSNLDAVVLAATDGELYGHHQPFRDLFLARLLDHADGFATVTPGAVMDQLDTHALERVTVREQSSWSCHHGVARWAGECPDVRDGRWKRPLRGALERFAAGLDAATEAHLAILGLDLWRLRDAWVDVASRFITADEWLEQRLAEGPPSRALSPASRRTVLALLSAQASRLQMFASDAFFWGDPRRLETCQSLRFAAHAARIVDAQLRTNLERRLVEDLGAVSAPDVPEDALAEIAHLRTGDQIYAAALSSISQPAPKI